MPKTGKKWALVTGGAKRIGAEISLRLAEDGYNIYLHYRSSKEEAEAVKKKAESYGAHVTLVSGDLSDAKAVERIFKSISPDVVVNNAAAFAVSKPEKNSLSAILKAEEEAFRVNMSANALGPLLVTKAALYRMQQEGKGGTFVFIGDAAIHGSGDAYTGDKDAYIMSKAFVPFLTRHRAQELGKEGFFFCSLLNGPIEPPPGAPKGTVKKVAQDLNIPKESLNPWLGGSEVAKAVSLLLKMSPGVNGISVPVDGARGRVTPREH
ncbi:MAG TPA: SDR family NAD(P)-dependent oxidoreductase [Candidatus Paceibacterota bacterium]|nr:SDR family NAD(P)-dependent oxidoreductase [Candidatus Paceibacterota bacterium]